jgi:ABC-type phosphate/phosphonate transport system substrate-binding protein
MVTPITQLGRGSFHPFAGRRNSASCTAPIRRAVGWRVFTALLASLAAVSASAAGTEGPSRAYDYGVVPYVTPIQLAKLHASIVSELGRVLGRTLRFHTGSSFEAFTRHLKRRDYDIAFIQPSDYQAAVVESGYIPLARMGEEHTAYIVVVPSSPLQSVQQLKGKTLALPPPVTPVCYLASAMLRQAGLDPHRDVALKHYKSHESCLQHVLIGAADACASDRMALQAFQAQRPVRFRILAESVSTAGPLFVVHPDVPATERKALENTILSWRTTTAGRELLQATGMEPFFPIRTQDDVSYRNVVHCAEETT